VPPVLFGIDVSHHQGTVNWPDVAKGGISFAYTKATEGSSFVDPLFDTNWIGMFSGLFSVETKAQAAMPTTPMANVRYMIYCSNR